MSHGAQVEEVPTGVRPAVQISAGIPVVFGTAPINSVDLTNVNKAKLALTLAEAESFLGPQSDDFDSWTLHEEMKAHFSVYEVAPVIFVNVLDPDNTDHVSTATAQSHQLIKGTVKLQVYGGPDLPQLGILKSTVVVKNQAGSTTYILGVDYALEFDADGFLVVTRISTGSIGASDIIAATFDYLDPSGVTADDIIGGYTAGAYTGLEVIEQVYPALRLVPGFIVAPKYSSIPEVAARMIVKARSINGAFRAVALVDLSTDSGDIATYADAPAWKEDNGFGSVDAFVGWLKVKSGDDVYHPSVVAACVANVTDSNHDNLPYASPSNGDVIGTSTVLDDGTEVLLTRPQANILNDQGIYTFINGFFGWKLWGNRTGGYPGTTDPKDSFLAIRRMFNWIGNTIILTTDRDIDAPINRRLVDSVLGTLQTFLNGLVAAGALISGTIEFRREENSNADLSDGKIKWHLTLTPPSPAEQMTFVLEYDPTALDALFAA